MTKHSNKKYHHGDLKAALLKAAEHLIIIKGIDALSLRGIATEAGVSHMAPYAHFKNKSELFQTIAASGFMKLARKLKRIKKKSLKSDDLVLLYGVAYIKFAISNPQLYKLMLSQTHPEQQVKKNIQIKKSVSESEKKLNQASRSTYILLRDCFTQDETDEHKLNIKAQGAWALVHGVASLLITGQIVIDKKLGIQDFLSIATQGLKN
ncbi:MAG: TetR/AcrR family transcriptional regulator [Marinicellaceae bacterium]